MAGGWKDTIRKVAPALGRALGLVGVPGATALAAVSQALLGKPDGTEAEVASRVANWQPADELALRTAEQKFAADMVDKAVALERIAADDRANARQREVAAKDWTPRALAIAIFAAFFALMVLMLVHAIPASNERPFDILLGGLIAGVSAVLSYYFGSSASSDTKTAILGRVAEGKR